MSTRAAPSPPLPVSAKLAALRRAVSLWFWIDGLTWLCLTGVGLAALSLLVDRTFRMDGTQRVLSLLIALGVLAGVAWRRVVRPLARALHDDALSLAVESRHGELGQGLITAVQLSRVPDARAIGSSPAMVRAAIQAGLDSAAGVDFNDTLDARRRRRNLAFSGIAVAVVAAASVLFPGTLGLWFSRNVLLSGRHWPQNTLLSILGANNDVLVCPRGDDLTVHVEAAPEGVVPSTVTLRYRERHGESGREPMVKVGPHTFRTILKNVLKPLDLYAYGGDGETPWCAVRLVERPGLASLRLAYQPPSYIGPSRVALPSNIGPHPVPFGSTVVVEGQAAKDLQEVALAFGKDKPRLLRLDALRTFHTTLAGDRLRSGSYALMLTDTDGYASKRPARFSLRVVPDRKPTVRARLEGIGDLIVPRATVPIACRLTDDYAVVAADIVYALHVEGEGDPTPRRLPFGARERLDGRKELATVHRLEAEPLGLQVGAHLTFRVEARDNDRVTGPKTGASGTFSLRVVTEDELRAELLRREQEQRLEFERLLRDQTKLLENTKALLAALKDRDTPALAAKERRLLGSSEKKQRLVGTRCVAVAERFTAILAEAENNKLEEADTPIRERLEARIIDPLRLLARRGVLQAADLLDVARKAAARKPDAADATKPGRVALVDAAAQQRQIVMTMRNILRNMVKWEGYQEAVSLLREVLKAQNQVSDETAREYRRRIEKIFED